MRVDLVGGITCVAYGIVIPCCFAVLFAKQHVIMQQSKIFFIACDDDSQGKVHLRLEFCEKSATFQESKTANLLVAAAAAHVAVHIRGNAAVELHKDEVIVTSLDGDSTQHHTVSAESLILPMTQKHTNILNRNAMMRMLTERILLEEAESDRIMMGAKRLLCKYASCRNVRMEVALKLASMALVSVVTARDGPWLSVAICLAMALVIGVARPYAKPQVNTLQSFSFSCLSVAALGFSHRFVQVARLALVAPLLLVVVQLLRPDSAQGLALRLQEELKDKIPEMQKGEVVEVNAEQLRIWQCAATVPVCLVEHLPEYTCTDEDQSGVGTGRNGQGHAEILASVLPIKGGRHQSLALQQRILIIRFGLRGGISASCIENEIPNLSGDRFTASPVRRTPAIDSAAVQLRPSVKALAATKCVFFGSPALFLGESSVKLPPFGRQPEAPDSKPARVAADFDFGHVVASFACGGLRLSGLLGSGLGSETELALSAGHRAQPLLSREELRKSWGDTARTPHFEAQRPVFTGLHQMKRPGTCIFQGMDLEVPLVAGGKNVKGTQRPQQTSALPMRYCVSGVRLSMVSATSSPCLKVTEVLASADTVGRAKQVAESRPLRLCPLDNLPQAALQTVVAIAKVMDRGGPSPAGKDNLGMIRCAIVVGIVPAPLETMFLAALQLVRAFASKCFIEAERAQCYEWSQHSKAPDPKRRSGDRGLCGSGSLDLKQEAASQLVHLGNIVRCSEQRRGQGGLGLNSSLSLADVARACEKCKERQWPGLGFATQTRVTPSGTGRLDRIKQCKLAACSGYRYDHATFDMKQKEAAKPRELLRGADGKEKLVAQLLTDERHCACSQQKGQSGASIRAAAPGSMLQPLVQSKQILQSGRKNLCCEGGEFVSFNSKALPCGFVDPLICFFAGCKLKHAKTRELCKLVAEAPTLCVLCSGLCIKSRREGSDHLPSLASKLERVEHASLHTLVRGRGTVLCSGRKHEEMSVSSTGKQTSGSQVKITGRRPRLKKVRHGICVAWVLPFSRLVSDAMTARNTMLPIDDGDGFGMTRSQAPRLGVRSAVYAGGGEIFSGMRGELQVSSKSQVCEVPDLRSCSKQPLSVSLKSSQF
ncbi:hypothetical protein AK812_SmicGene35263 [Symbiodinium microadriaticum]|uniref:Uncharacterized protein n=1 Tax=Symbiodinium microadriaticum TaxID=2951 RepID=A0A1Q9CLV9_SYMMI|nr:hypothetical protein AK812_SmicGene35263 [Symbiodinium microadriaticum]